MKLHSIGKITTQEFTKRKLNSGFTLVEALIAVAIFSFIAGGIFTTFLVGTNYFETNKVRAESQQNLRLAMDRIREDIRQTGKAAIIDVPANGNWYTSMTFRLVDSVDSNGVLTWPQKTVQYYLGGTTNSLLMRKIDNNGTVEEDRIITSNIKALQFRRQSASPSIVEVNLTVEKISVKGITLTLNDSFSVMLRN